MVNRRQALILVSACTMLVWSGFLLRLNASDPSYRIYYDTPLSVSCEEIARSGNTKVVAVAIPISIRFEGNPRALEDVKIELQSFDRTARVVDFLPKTTMVTNVAGPIRVETTNQKGGKGEVRFESKKNVGITGKVRFDSEGSLGGGVEVDYKEMTKKSYEQLPPRQMLLASGIQERSHGVFFKIKPNEQHPIEGQHNFMLLLQVDLSWRGECISARFSPGSNAWWGRVDPVHVIGLHLQDDVEAKAVVEQATKPIFKFKSETVFDIEKLREIENSTFYPWFGKGSKAESVRKRIAEPKANYDKALSDIRGMNSRK